MKSMIYCFGVIVVCLSACTGYNSQPSTPKLVQLKDSINVYRYEYSGNNISGVWFDSSGFWQNYTAVTPAIRVISYSYGTHYIKATYPPGELHTYTEYNLNNASLPVSILHHDNVGGIDSIVARMDFYYHGNSNEIDSAVDRGYYPSAYHFKSVPQYANGNITQYTLIMSISGSVPSQQVYSFTYSPVPNITRTTDPLLYIYNNPWARDFPGRLAIIFSNNTMQSITAYGSVHQYHYSVNSNSKMVYEDLGALPYMRSYIYQ